MAAVFACTPGTPEEPLVLSETIYASAEVHEGAESRVRLSGSHQIWESGDRISVFMRSSANVPYLYKGQDGASRGEFAADGSAGSGSALDAVYAVYPYDSWVTAAGGKLTLTLPKEQNYRASCFGAGANVMVAASEDNILQFRNIGGFFVLRLHGSGVKVSSIELSGNNGETLSGKAVVSIPVGGTPSVAMSSGMPASVKLVCKEPVALGESASDATEFWFALPPVTFSKGITLAVNTVGAGVFEKSSSERLEIGRCKAVRTQPLEVSSVTHVSYAASSAIFPNPERGYYTTHEFHSDKESALNSSRLSAKRKEGETLVMLEYYLTDFVSGDISSKYLTLMEKNFKALRSAGVKCILRFAYSDSEDSHPYDATEAQVLSHIAQIKPLLQSYWDVIYVMQAGFVGVWGEWYYTDNFVYWPKSESDYQPRKHVADALLAALPEARQIAVRTPTFKMKMYGYSLKDTITAKTAFGGTPLARIAGHNDCFVSSENDVGTFQDDKERAYWKAETRYTIMGGESCELTDYCHCSNYSGKPGAMANLEDYHFSYLHSGYHLDVLRRWQDEGCSDEIKRRLGYRICLEEGWFGAAVPGSACKVTLTLRNVGFAAPMNPRGAYILLTDESDNVVAESPLGSDPRTWPPGRLVTVNCSVNIPKGLSGTYKLQLNLPDGASSLSDNPKYSIRLANDGVWSEATGYNLLKTIKL